MSNRPSAQHTDQHTDQHTATYPTGWRGRPSGYIHPGDPRLVRADATPTGAFPTRRSIRPLGQASRAARPEQETDAASTARTRPGARACHAPSQPSTEQAAPSPIEHEGETPLQDMGRPGPLARPTMAWHPSLMQLAIGAAIVAALLGACNVAAIQAHRQARAHCHALVVSDWARAQRECRGTGSGTPVPEQAPQPPAPRQAHQQAPQPEWVTRDTHAAYDRTDPAASPLSLPRCTAAPDTPMPCLAHVSADSHHAVVLEEDASLTGLMRQ